MTEHKPATDDWIYGDRVANDQFVARCKQKVIDLMPFVYPDVGMLIARIETQQAEIARLRGLLNNQVNWLMSHDPVHALRLQGDMTAPQKEEPHE